MRVKKLDPVSLSALVYDRDENPYWADFYADNPAAWKAASEKTTEFIGGTWKGGYIYAHDGSNLYKVDADLFQVVQNCGPVAAAWQWSDAAPAPAIGDLFDAIIGVCNEGMYLEMVYPEEGNLSYWDMSWDVTSPMAAIAYAGSGTYDYVYYAKEYPDCPANFYYVMTEDGGLWTIVVLTFDDGESYVVDYDRLGSVPGIRLTGVSGITAGQYASMVYDPVTGYLMLSSYMEGEENNLYAIHPETLLATNLGSFGEKVWPVVSMYQYERATELTVKLNMTAADMDGNDSLNLTAKVVPAAYQKGVTWSTSNPSVATVDENGVVTAVAEGNAVITATSVDQNASGMAATATCNVTVRGLAAVDADREVPEFRMGTGTVSSSLVSFGTSHLAGQRADATPEAANVSGGSVNSTGTVQTDSIGETAEDEKTVTVEVTAKDAAGKDVASTNGLIAARYDVSHLTLQSVVVHADYQAVAQSDGTVKFAYADTGEIPAGSSVATLIFQVRSGVKTGVSILTEEVNALAPAYCETLEISYEHAHTEVRNGKEATCTEEGYTGDVYCTDCGQLVARGEVIPALGHKIELRNAKEATCTEAGYTGDEVCTRCGEVVKEGQVLPAHCFSRDFIDLDSSQWYHKYTDYVIERGLMNGMSQEKFAPNGILTRGQLVTILHRLAGSPTPTGASPFTDVKEGRYYTEAVSWAAEQGLAQGVTETRFVPEAPATREQLVTFLYRYAAMHGVDTAAGGSLSNFPDASSVSEYAQQPMLWAVQTGLLQGMDGRLAPKASATRAQTAAFLTRFCENILKGE